MRINDGFVPLADLRIADSERERETAALLDLTGRIEAEQTPRLPHSDDGERDWPVDLRSVSVVIPYSKPDKIDNCIRSVLSQNYPMDLLEILVVGKGSTEVQQRWPQVRAIDGGPIFRPGRARNLGARSARGEVLLFIDDDCIAELDWLQENLAELETESVGAVSGMVVGTSRNASSRAVDFSNFGLCQIDVRQERALCTATFAIDKKVFEEVGGFDESLKVHEDIDICHRLINSGYKTVYQPRVKVLHDHGRESIGSLISYLYFGGKEGGLTVEESYASQSSLYRLLLRLKHPLVYLPAILPLAAAATLQTIEVNVARHKSVLLLSPLIFVGKLSCHMGIWRWTVQEWMKHQNALREVRRLVEYTLFKRWFSTPRVITLFVTSQCNAKCKHCFYWENLNQNNDLSFDEIEALSQSLGKVDVLLISGGEPMLRRDLPEICQLFFENNNLGGVSIPTNGLQPERTYEHARRILEIGRGRPVTISFSIDGMEKYHDEMRGVPGNFRRLQQTYARVKTLQEAFPNLILRVATTVMQQNYEEVMRLFDEMPSVLPGVNSPCINILRGSPYDRSLMLPTDGQIRQLFEHKAARSPGKQGILRRLADRLTFAVAFENLRQNTQVVPCEAGRILGVVEDNGNVKPCELLPPVGNLRNGSFDEIWNSEQAEEARRRIVGKKCHCTHECNTFPSLMANPIHVVKLVGSIKR